ncbi:MAG: ribosomal L7Ae/L30e/S12e/Gadd45 family protein [Lachnospiraceae bacterium]|nr:ribosomal L7Ae/L30e/S12e/Gadd45 family protein [Lachnospiraceae bacterium]
MLGIAQKAGVVVSGEFATEKAVKEGTAFLVILAEDASDNTKKKFNNTCEYYNCEIIYGWNKEVLGNAIGKRFRASLAICDENFANAIKNKIV